MLAVVVVSVGSMLWFSNLAVQREFKKLPPEVQTYLRVQQEAARRGEVLAPMPPIPEILTGMPTDPYLAPSMSSPDVSGIVNNPNGDAIIIEQGQRVRSGDGNRNNQPRNFVPRTKDFLLEIQRSLINVGLISAAASALLAFLLSSRLAKPIVAVSNAAKKLAQGNLSARAPLLSSEREVAGLAQSFNDMASNLQSLERERQQAVADIAHELRTPIAIMQARLDALEDGVYPMNAEQIVLLSVQTQVLTGLVSNLQTLTLADAGQLTLNPAPTDLSVLAGEVVRDLSDRATAKHLSLQFKASVAPIHADPARMRQIASNLIENALQHATKRVEVHVETQGQNTLMHIEDDGPGIPEESYETVFTRFARLDESRARNTGGSGLGLAIVRALVTAQGGSVKASRSRLGGASFTVTLPMLDSQC